MEGRPELRDAARQIMKTVKATGQRLDRLSKTAQRNGRLDRAAIDRSMSRILKAAEEINREVSDLLEKARQ
ncbi:MAG TPA: hypothetical protein VEJ86_13780 [Candidatus Binataceae bacterium]|nr:hypothetical protein [Candidatus Binataceae bacterium]